MKRSYLILTDSGGIQEEAPYLRKPVLVLRDKTDRPEVIKAGLAKLVDTDPRNIVGAAKRLLKNKCEYKKMIKATKPYGDGTASEKIINILIKLKNKHLI